MYSIQCMMTHILLRGCLVLTFSSGPIETVKRNSIHINVRILLLFGKFPDIVDVFPTAAFI